MERIVITGMGSISPLGYRRGDIAKNYASSDSCIIQKQFSMGVLPAAVLKKDAEEEIAKIKDEHPAYRHLDRTALMAIFAARVALKNAGWKGDEIAVNIGSSRGATDTYEQRFEQFLDSGKKNASVYTSPATTLGNISSWVMQDLNLEGPKISHSITCSTGMQALANGVAWLRAGMADKFLAGAAEAPLTDFTLAQMRALKIYSTDVSEYPCKPFTKEENSQNRMVLGEGAAVFALEKWRAEINEKVLGEILSIGFGNEKLSSPSSISRDGECIYKSMKSAIKNLESSVNIDMIICHAPGTINGDAAELNAINNLFGGNPPLILSNKWKIGHTLGASGLFSLEYALIILNGLDYVDIPYTSVLKNSRKPVKTIMINAAGFGGGAVSLIVSK